MNLDELLCSRAQGAEQALRTRGPWPYQVVNQHLRVPKVIVDISGVGDALDVDTEEARLRLGAGEADDHLVLKLLACSRRCRTASIARK